MKNGDIEDGGEGSHTGKELGDVVSFAMHNHPARVLGVVLGDSGSRELVLAHGGV